MDPASVMPEEQVAGEGGEALVAEFKTSEEEANTLAQWIQECIAEGVKPSEIAVLIGKLPEAYAEQLMAALAGRGVPFRNEQKLQDLTAEPLAKLVVDFLRCVYGEREPQAWLRLMQLLVPFADDDLQATKPIERFIAAKRKESAANTALGEPYANWWDKTFQFLKLVGAPTLIALSPEYESKPRLNAVARDVKERLTELMVGSGDLMAAVSRFYEDESVRILSIHKSKGLEYEVVVMMGIEKELFFGKIEDERSTFFVGISRAKRFLLLTWCQHRTRPVFPVKRWEEDRRPQKEFLGYVDV
jgi:superfamily I DNA/RNA helicase